MPAGEGATYEDYVDRIHYSDRYSDDTYEYRHVILPKGLLKLSQSRSVMEDMRFWLRTVACSDHRRVLAFFLGYRAWAMTLVQFLQIIASCCQYFQPDGQVLRLLTDSEWRGIGTLAKLFAISPRGVGTEPVRHQMKWTGIQQSLGWSHFECHAPEPHILLFRREKDYQAKYPNGKPQ
ncbi:BQ2448_5585 [Microbotryum intermedium]|uniref:Cyclin-dependent kinases regulatory subunit n=1 Tax=Microbotryum intermedium TaxID=269621 RepID=A0A238F2K7_9BASI|nr:BQ2448_5585 [Microbotryum intermedium]